MTFSRVRLLYFALLYFALLVAHHNRWLTAAVILCAVWLIAWMIDDWRTAPTRTERKVTLNAAQTAELTAALAAHDLPTITQRPLARIARTVLAQMTGTKPIGGCGRGYVQAR